MTYSIEIFDVDKFTTTQVIRIINLLKEVGQSAGKIDRIKSQLLDGRDESFIKTVLDECDSDIYECETQTELADQHISKGVHIRKKAKGYV